MKKLYYIQDSRTFCGNCMFFWCVDGQGYTCDIDKAWKVTKEQAFDQHRSRSSDIPRLVSDVEAVAKRHADMQSFK